MSFRELTMIDVREVLRRWQAGHSVRRTHRETGFDRKTVRRYHRGAELAGLPHDIPLTDEQVHAVASRIQARPVPVTGEHHARLLQHKTLLATWKEERPRPQLQTVQNRLQRMGVDIPYWTLRRFAIEEMDWSKRSTTVRLADPDPGQEAQLDFGRMGVVLDVVTGKSCALHALIITLAYSRLLFVHVTLRQTTAAVCEGLEAAWRFFGGMPRVLIPDNTKAMIDLADPKSPRLVVAFADYIQTRGLFVDPARVRHPKDKARVERAVPYVRNNWFRSEQPRDLEHAREGVERWCREVAGRRVHGTTRRVPWEVYDESERARMLVAPTEPYDVPTWLDATVGPDHHLHALHALYSAPEHLIKATLRVRVDTRLVRLYAGTELVSIHERQPPGGCSTKPEHYPEHKRVYATRDVEGTRVRAEALGANIGRFVGRLLEAPEIWLGLRRATSLLKLCDRFGPGRVEAICQSALSFDVVDVGRVERMLHSSQTLPQTTATRSNVVPLRPPRFARSAEHFATRKPTQEGA